MTKAISFFLLVTCAFTACRHNNGNYLNLIENDWKKDKLKGRVKKIVKRDSVTGSSDLHSSIVEYNEKGFIAQKVDSSIMPHRTMVVTYVYRYDTINNTTFVSILLNGVQQKQEQYVYDQAGNLVEEIRSMSKTTYSYDDKGRVVKKENYALGALNDTKISEYRPDGSSITVYTDEVTKRKKSETFTTDSVEIYKSFDVDGKVRSTWLYRRDKAGNLLYSEGRNGDGTLDSYTKRFYNQYNDDTMAITFSSHSNIFDTINTKFTYDKTGNWTKVKGTLTREITYW
jgi:hypothetical protein